MWHPLLKRIIFITSEFGQKFRKLISSYQTRLRDTGLLQLFAQKNFWEKVFDKQLRSGRHGVRVHQGQKAKLDPQSTQVRLLRKKFLQKNLESSMTTEIKTTQGNFRIAGEKSTLFQFILLSQSAWSKTQDQPTHVDQK